MKRAERTPLMAHLVAGYPDRDASFRVAEALAEGGASILEVQFPFSDPSADGPVIQEACTVSLSRGFTSAEGFRLVRRISSEIGVPVFVMSYASMVYAHGISRFLAALREAGGQGIIVPDLPPDSDEGLFAAAREERIHALPVVAPGMSAARLRMVAALEPEYLYASLRAGITGGRTQLGADNLDFLRSLKAVGARVLAGFGIESAEQVDILAPHVFGIVAGSVFVRIIREAIRTGGRPEDELRRKAGELAGAAVT